MPKVRLVQMIVQPVLVTDDGDTLSPLQVQQITVNAADWPEFSGETWPEMAEKLEAL